MKQCPHCQAEIVRPSRDGRKQKIRTTILVLHKSGEVEVNCPSCKRGIILPLQAGDASQGLKKAQPERLVIPRRGSRTKP